MSRFFIGLGLAVVGFAAVRFLTGDPALAVFVGAVLAISVWFRAVEILLEQVWAFLDRI